MKRGGAGTEVGPAPALSGLRELWAQIRAVTDTRIRRRLAAGAGASVLLAALEMAGLAMIVPLIEALNDVQVDRPSSSSETLGRLFGTNEPTTVALYAGISVVSLFILKGVLSILFTRWSFRALAVSEAAARSRLFAAYLDAPITYHLAHNTGELNRTLLSSLPQVYQGILSFAMTGLADAVTLASIMVLLFVVEPVVAAVAVTYFTVVGFAYQRAIHGRARAAAERLHEGRAREYQIVQQSLSALKEIRVMGRQQHFVETLAGLERDLAPQTATMLLLLQLPRYFLEIALMVGVALMSAVLFSTTAPERSVAVLGLFLAAGFRSLPSLNRVLVAISSIRSGAPALRQVEGDLRSIEEAVERVDRDRMITAGGADDLALMLDDVWFSYPDQAEPALRGVTLHVEAGERVAIVGRSGSGKTTLADIVLGLLTPDAGRASMGGFGAAGSTPEGSVGYVPQDVVILDSTVRENIVFGYDGDYTEDDIWVAVNAAQLGEVVSALPRQLESPLGERGARLSGGERQRIGIARALFRTPSLLVLDEATSALDVATEASVSAMIESIPNVVTTLVIAHRLSTVRSCSRVLLLENGSVVASGTFDELERNSEVFAHWVRLGAVPTGSEESARDGTTV